MKLSRKRTAILATILIATVLVSVALANTFFFNFFQTPYKPTQYRWTQPWTVTKMLDFVEATLNVTGSGYQDTLHSYSLMLKNVNPNNHILLSCNYEVLWDNGASNQTIITGSVTSQIVKDANQTFTGTFTPTTYGSGQIRMAVTNILWGTTDPITWTYTIINPFTSKISVETFAVTSGAAQGLQAGVITTKINGVSNDENVQFTIRIVETSQLVATESGLAYMTTGKTWTSNFTPNTGGPLTLVLNITSCTP